MNEFDTIKTTTQKALGDRIAEAGRTLKQLYANDNSKDFGGYEPILKEWNYPVCPVSINDAMNLFLDLAAADGATEDQVTFCRYFMVSIPGKNFCDAQWILDSLAQLDDSPDKIEMPDVVQTVDIGAMVDHDLGGEPEPPDGFGSGGSGGPLIPANSGPDSGPSPDYLDS